MKFINTLEFALNQLLSRGWKVDKDVDTEGRSGPRRILERVSTPRP